jgi:hypothetical protein
MIAVGEIDRLIATIKCRSSVEFFNRIDPDQTVGLSEADGQ